MFPLDHALTPEGPCTRWRITPPTTRRSTMEGKAMVATQEARAFAGASLPVGEPVTLVIEEERFFGWVASASPADSLACVSIEFTRGSRNAFRLKISRGLEIIYKRIRNYARRRRKELRCGKVDRGVAACTQYE